MLRHATAVLICALSVDAAGHAASAASRDDVPNLLLTTETKLTASDAEASDFFGRSVAMSGDTVIVGANGEDCGLANLSGCGAAYVYVRSWAGWTQQQKLLASDAAAGEQFGNAVAIDGDTAVVGASNSACPVSGVNCGAAYVFLRTGTVWTEQEKLVASDAAPGAFFGSSVAVSGTTVVVGAPYDGCNDLGDLDCGAAYVFVADGNGWSEQQKLVSGDQGFGSDFGYSVAIDGDTAVVGDDAFSAGSSGAAYVFVRNGAVWAKQQKLVGSDAAGGDLLGVSVAVSGDTVVAGAEAADCPVTGLDCGAAYVFVRNGGVWTEQQKLVASDTAASDFFGRSVALSGEIVVVGAFWDDCLVAGLNCGSAYVFARNGMAWAEQQKLVASDQGFGDNFGTAVAVSGHTAVAGAMLAECPVSGVNCGAAYVYDPPDPIFADGFESGDLSAWSTSAADGGDLSVTIDAGMAPIDNGFNYGLQAFVNDRNALYVEDQTPDNELRYRVKFFVAPHTFDPGEAGGRFRVRILLGFDSDPLLRRQFAVVLRRKSGEYSLMVRTTRADGTRANTSFFPLTPGPHSIELDWQRSSAAGVADGRMTLWIDDELKQVVPGLDTGLYGIDQVRMGLTSIKQGANGILYFDRFESRRYGQIP
jgi:hypothetical protein